MTVGTIIVVDDDDDVRETVVDALSHRNHRVLVASDGIEALAHLDALERPVRYCVVVTDFQMPGMDGIRLARSIRRDPQLAAVRILLLTSTTRTNDTADTDVVMTKPFELTALRDAVDRLMGAA